MCLEFLFCLAAFYSMSNSGESSDNEYRGLNMDIDGAIPEYNEGEIKYQSFIKL